MIAVYWTLIWEHQKALKLTKIMTWSHRIRSLPQHLGKCFIIISVFNKKQVFKLPWQYQPWCVSHATIYHSFYFSLAECIGKMENFFILYFVSYAGPMRRAGYYLFSFLLLFSSSLSAGTREQESFNHHRYLADGILIPVLRQALSFQQVTLVQLSILFPQSTAANTDWRNRKLCNWLRQ